MWTWLKKVNTCYPVWYITLYWLATLQTLVKKLTKEKFDARWERLLHTEEQTIAGQKCAREKNAQNVGFLDGFVWLDEALIISNWYAKNRQIKHLCTTEFSRIYSSIQIGCPSVVPIYLQSLYWIKWKNSIRNIWRYKNLFYTWKLYTVAPEANHLRFSRNNWCWTNYMRLYWHSFLLITSK